MSPTVYTEENMRTLNDAAHIRQNPGLITVAAYPFMSTRRPSNP